MRSCFAVTVVRVTGSGWAPQHPPPEPRWGEPARSVGFAGPSGVAQRGLLSCQAKEPLGRSRDQSAQRSEYFGAGGGQGSVGFNPRGGPGPERPPGGAQTRTRHDPAGPGDST